MKHAHPLTGGLSDFFVVWTVSDSSPDAHRDELSPARRLLAVTEKLIEHAFSHHVTLKLDGDDVHMDPHDLCRQDYSIGNGHVLTKLRARLDRIETIVPEHVIERQSRNLEKHWLMRLVIGWLWLTRQKARQQQFRATIAARHRQILAQQMGIILLRTLLYRTRPPNRPEPGNHHLDVPVCARVVA